MPSPLYAKSEKGSGRTCIALASHRNAIIDWVSIRKHTGMINILVMPLALGPTEHKYDDLVDQGLSILTNIERSTRQEANTVPNLRSLPFAGQS